MKLDLGSGPYAAEGFEGVDISGAQHRLDLFVPQIWPWPDDSIEGLRSAHFIEHVPAECRDCWEPTGPIGNLGASSPLRQVYKDLLVHFFDEAWRVIRPGGTFELYWPCYQSVFAFQDPTHRRFIPARQLMYFSREFRDNNRLGFLNARCNWVVQHFEATVLRPESGDPVSPELDETIVDGAERLARYQQALYLHQQESALAEYRREHEWNHVSEYHATLVAVKP